MVMSYKREANRNYLIMQIEDVSDYRIRMITENKPASLLRSELREWNGEAFLYMDIGSKQPISVMFEKNTIGFDTLKFLIQSLHEAFAEANRYLLGGDCICVKPEFCFVRPGTDEYEWMFCPYTEENGFEEFAEFLIDKASGYDKKCVETAHNIYRLIKVGNVDTKELVALVDNADEFLTEIKTPTDYECADRQKFQYKPDNKDNLKKDTLFDHIKKKLGIGKHKQEDALLSDDWVNERDIQEFRPNIECRETRVINLNDKPERRVLVGTGKKDREEHAINTFPFIAGKMSEQADLILNSTLCSRIHARFTEEEGHIYIEDLNSTNGTFKNGLRLEYGEKVRLIPGDELKLGDITFVYE